MMNIERAQLEDLGTHLSKSNCLQSSGYSKLQKFIEENSHVEFGCFEKKVIDVELLNKFLEGK